MTIHDTKKSSLTARLRKKYAVTRKNLHNTFKYAVEQVVVY